MEDLNVKLDSKGGFSDPKNLTVLKGLVCARCSKNTNELFMCEKCQEDVCDKCLATYNQFTQIDFNCCKPCANTCDADYEP